MNDGCFYRVETANDFQYYFLDLKKAEKFLWEYYLETRCGREDNQENKDYNYFTLTTIGRISGIGTIFEEYFEDYCEGEDE